MKWKTTLETNDEYYTLFSITKWDVNEYPYADIYKADINNAIKDFKDDL